MIHRGSNSIRKPFYQLVYKHVPVEGAREYFTLSENCIRRPRMMNANGFVILIE